MKNNFITKIIGATLAFAMMIGGAVGIVNSKRAAAVYADDPTYTLGYTKNASNSNYATEYTVSSGGINWKVYANVSTEAGYYIGGKGTNNLTRTFTSTGYLSKSIDRIVIHTGAMDAGSASVTAKASTNSSFASDNKQFSSTALTANDDFEITYDEGTDANSYFQLTFTVNPNNSKNNRKVVVTSVDFYEHVASAETITGVSASLKDGTYYAGDTLSASDFNVTVSWSGEKADTHPLSGFTWTVNGDENGTLIEGNNSVIVTYQEVDSAPFNVAATIEPGTIESNPLTSTQAIALGGNLANNAETTKDYYIQGVVSQVNYNSLASGSKQATFWLLDGDTIQGFEAYNIKADENCTNYDELLPGAEVLLFGKIKKYNSTIETGANALIKSIHYVEPVLTGISLNKNSTSIEVGQTETLTPSPIPNIATVGTVTWISSNINVATVANGVVTALTEGASTITAFKDANENGQLDNGEINATCTVTVTAAPAEKVIVVNSISVGNTVYMIVRDALKQYSGQGGTESTPYGNGASYTGTPDKDGITFEVMEGNAEGSFAFKIKSGTDANKYIAWNSGNTLAVIDSITNNSSWNVSFDSDGNASIANVADETRIIWWNNSSPRLACYQDKTAGSGWKTTQLCMLKTPTSYFESASSIRTINGVANYVDEEVTSVSSVALRFGTTIAQADWAAINANWAITDYGVMLLKQTTLASYSKASVEAAFRDNLVVTNLHKGSNAAPATLGDDYFFTVKINIEDASDYDTVYCAAPYIIAGGRYFFFNEMSDSVRTMAGTNPTSSLPAAALDFLAGNYGE